MNITLGQLDQLERSCMDLMNSTFGLTSESLDLKKSTDNIARAIRKIVLASVLAEKQVICISGLQGAGKTTMMKNFYDIDDGILDESTGRGERIPIFFCERKNCTEIKLYAVCLKKEDNVYKEIRVDISADEFVNVGKGDKPDDSYVMYLEVQNPYRHFKNETSTFMLLPGFEKKNDYWQELIDLSVQCSASSVFVCDESRLATYDNEELRERIAKKFGDSVIYAISRSDLSGDDNAEAKETLLERMRIPQGEKDRVICVGAYNDHKKNEKWIEELKNSIEKYCNSVEVSIINNTKYIGDIIDEEIMPEISDLRSCINLEGDEVLTAHLDNSPYLTAFDEIVRSRKKQLEKQLDESLRSSTCKSKERLYDFFTNKEKAEKRGVYDSSLNKVKRTIFGENVKDIKLAQNRVNEALKDDDGVYDYQKAFVSTVLTIVESVDQNNECKNILLNYNDESFMIDAFETVEVTSDDNNKKQQETWNHIIHDVGCLLTKGSLDEFQHDNLEETMKVVVELGTQYFALATLQQVDMEKSGWLENEFKVELDKLNISYEDVRNKIGSTEKVIWGTLGIAGVDLAGDGILNAVPVLAEALGVSVTAACAVAVAIVGAVAGVAIISDINRVERTEYASAENAIMSVQSQIKGQYLGAYVDAMNIIRGRIEDNLIDKSGVNKTVTKKRNMLIALNRIEEVLEGINKEVNSDINDIGNAFGR